MRPVTLLKFVNSAESLPDMTLGSIIMANSDMTIHEDDSGKLTKYVVTYSGYKSTADEPRTRHYLATSVAWVEYALSRLASDEPVASNTTDAPGKKR